MEINNNNNNNKKHNINTVEKRTKKLTDMLFILQYTGILHQKFNSQCLI